MAGVPTRGTAFQIGPIEAYGQLLPEMLPTADVLSARGPGISSKLLKLWWTHQGSNLGPAD